MQSETQCRCLLCHLPREGSCLRLLGKPRFVRFDSGQDTDHLAGLWRKSDNLCEHRVTQVLHRCWGAWVFSVCFPGGACGILHRQDNPLWAAREAEARGRGFGNCSGKPTKTLENSHPMRGIPEEGEHSSFLQHR